jgi:hypothetical protein
MHDDNGQLASSYLQISGESWDVYIGITVLGVCRQKQCVWIKEQTLTGTESNRADRWVPGIGHVAQHLALAFDNIRCYLHYTATTHYCYFRYNDHATY